MNETGAKDDQLGTVWIVAMVVLVLLLILGIVVYLRLGPPPETSHRRRVSTVESRSAQSVNNVGLRLGPDGYIDYGTR